MGIVTPGLFSVSGVYDGIRQMFLVIFYGNKDDTFVTIKNARCTDTFFMYNIFYF